MAIEPQRCMVMATVMYFFWKGGHFRFQPFLFSDVSNLVGDCFAFPIKQM